MEIRKMTVEDTGQAAALEEQIFSMPWSRQGFLDAVSRPETCFLVAVQDEQVCGYCGYYRSLYEAEIMNVAVPASFRRKKIGSALLARLLAEGKKEGVREFYLEVRISNLAAISLYRAFGFQTMSVRKGFYERPKEDAYVMRLEIGQDTGSISH